MEICIYVLTLVSFLFAAATAVISLKKISDRLKALDGEDDPALPVNYKWKKFRNAFVKPVLYLIVPFLISVVASVFNPYFSETVKPEPFGAALVAVAICFVGFYALFGRIVKKHSLIADSWEILLCPAGAFGALLILETSFISACALYTLVSLIGV